MMNDYKHALSKQIGDIVAQLCHGTLVSCEWTLYGMRCDFDMPHPLNPHKIKDIQEALYAYKIPCAYEILGFSGAYLLGDASQRMLQRIDVAAFETNAELTAYQQRRQQAQERDHKKLGAQLDLFSTSDKIGSGLILWHPQGAMIRHLLEQFSQNAHILNDYQWVYTPHIGKAGLWRTSGHLDFYEDSMYSPMIIDEEKYYLKPMNCPFHISIYNSQMRSYRDLPLRYAEYGTVYRYELSGVLQGLTRVRGFTQDDSHIFCMPEQVQSEITAALRFSLYILRSFGLGDFKLYISTKPKDKFIGSDHSWDFATSILKHAVLATGMDYDIDEGGGAFYGPKIDLKLQDSLGREWQCSTIQFDFNLPERFQMGYVGADGKTHTPLMVHRALFGSIERFIALLIEYYQGDFPLWFAPVQFAIVPVKPHHHDYCRKQMIALKQHGLRVEADYSDNHMREKIKRLENRKIPFILVVGDKEVIAESFSLRSRKQGNLGLMCMEDILAHIKSDLEMGQPRYIMER